MFTKFCYDRTISSSWATWSQWNPDFSNPRFLETRDNSNQVWISWDKLTPDKLEPVKISDQLSPAVNYSSIYHFSKVIKYFFLLRKSHSTPLKVNIKSHSVILHIEDSSRTLMLLLRQLLKEMLGLHTFLHRTTLKPGSHLRHNDITSWS